MVMVESSARHEHAVLAFDIQPPDSTPRLMHAAHHLSVLQQVLISRRGFDDRWNCAELKTKSSIFKRWPASPMRTTSPFAHQVPHNSAVCEVSRLPRSAWNELPAASLPRVSTLHVEDHPWHREDVLRLDCWSHPDQMRIARKTVELERQSAAQVAQDCLKHLAIEELRNKASDLLTRRLAIPACVVAVTVNPSLNLAPVDALVALGLISAIHQFGLSVARREPGQPGPSLRMPQDELAILIQWSRQQVNRAWRGLKNDGLFAFGCRRKTLVDRSGLERQALSRFSDKSGASIEPELIRLPSRFAVPSD